MEIIALVPMKGNSERVPNKNLRLFNGKPLYHALMNSLIKSSLITKIIINTDSEKIKADVQTHFPSVIVNDRPTDICGDYVSMNEIIAHDIKSYPSDIYIQTHSTNPLLKAETIDNALSKFLNSKSYDSVFSVTKHLTRLYWQNGEPVNHNPEELLRTQDLPPVLEENSNFYIFTKASFEAAGKKRIGSKPLMYEVDKLEAVDIDDPQDFILAELLYINNI